MGLAAFYYLCVHLLVYLYLDFYVRSSEFIHDRYLHLACMLWWESAAFLLC